MSELEVDLCDRLREWAERLGFEVYPEVSGWDMVLVAAEDRTLVSTSAWRVRRGPREVPAGHQVGIHAKLRASCELLVQAMPPRWGEAPYPHLPFVAAPRPGEGFRALAQRLGIGVIDTDPLARVPRWLSKDEERKRADPRVVLSPTFEPGADHHPLKLPPIASRAIAAGAPSPRVLSAWRVAAIRFVTWARTVETYTTTDVVRFGINRAWAERWGEYVETRAEVRRGRTVRVHVYRLASHADRLPDHGYQDVAAELLAADAATAPAPPAPPAGPPNGGPCPSP